MPVALLLEHNVVRPLARVITLEAVGTQLRFEAELVNSDRLYWASQVWEKIVAQDVTRISIEGKNFVKQIGGFTNWRVNEVSVVAMGADQGAVITRVWERQSVVYADGRPSEVVHWGT